MKIIIDLEPFLKRLNEAKNIYDLISLCRMIRRSTSLFVKKRLLEIKAELHVISILGEKWQRSKPKTDIELKCVKCGQLVSPEEIKRNGHYNKGIEFDEGYEKLWIPQLVHKKKSCLGVINIQYPFLEKRQRFWFDVLFNIVGYYFEGIGLRGIKRIFEVGHNTNIGIMSIWRMIQRIGGTLRLHCEMPEVDKDKLNIRAIGLDEIFMRLRIFRGKGRKILKETIYGLMTKAIGKGMPLLGLKISRSRDEESWQEEVDRVYEQGINHDHALKMAVCDDSDAIMNALQWGQPKVVIQQCLFHVHKNILRMLREQYTNSRNKNKIIKKIKDQTRKILSAASLERASNRLEQIKKLNFSVYAYLRPKLKLIFTHQGSIPAVSTNNDMERENREFKRRLKVLESFKSVYGAENFGAIMFRREFYRLQKLNWLENTFKQIPLELKPIKSFKIVQERAPCLSCSTASKSVGSKRKINKNINYELPIIRSSHSFGNQTLKRWIDGYSILEY
jgi:hypothetical protein